MFEQYWHPTVSALLALQPPNLLAFLPFVTVAAEQLFWNPQTAKVRQLQPVSYHNPIITSPRVANFCHQISKGGEKLSFVTPVEWSESR